MFKKLLIILLAVAFQMQAQSDLDRGSNGQTETSCESGETITRDRKCEGCCSEFCCVRANCAEFNKLTAASIAGALTGTAILTNLSVSGGGNIVQDLEVGGQVNIGGPLIVSGDENIGGDLFVEGTITSNGSAVVVGSFANFFALMPGDNAATVAVGSAVQFPKDGPGGDGTITRSGGSSPSVFQLAAIGAYEVTWQVSVDEAAQLMLRLNSVELNPTVVGRATGTTQLVGSTIIVTTTVNSLLEVINPSGGSTALTVTPVAGGVHPVSATLTIKRLS